MAPVFYFHPKEKNTYVILKSLKEFKTKESYFIITTIQISKLHKYEYYNVSVVATADVAWQIPTR